MAKRHRHFAGWGPGGESRPVGPGDRSGRRYCAPGPEHCGCEMGQRRRLDITRHSAADHADKRARMAMRLEHVLSGHVPSGGSPSRHRERRLLLPISLLWVAYFLLDTRKLVSPACARDWSSCPHLKLVHQFDSSVRAGATPRAQIVLAHVGRLYTRSRIAPLALHRAPRVNRRDTFQLGRNCALASSAGRAPTRVHDSSDRRAHDQPDRRYSGYLCRSSYSRPTSRPSSTITSSASHDEPVMRGRYVAA